MSANAENTLPQQPANKKGKRKSALILLTLLFIIIAVAYGIYWFLVLRHVEETDDAYVAGNQVQIMAQVSGSVTNWVMLPLSVSTEKSAASEELSVQTLSS